jgi:HSP20 family protein
MEYSFTNKKQTEIPIKHGSSDFNNLKNYDSDSAESQLSLDVYQTEKEIVIKSTIGGVSSEDIDIILTNDMLTIKGARSQDEQIDPKDYYYQECYWGPFSRSVILPMEVEADQIKANIKNTFAKSGKSKIKKNYDYGRIIWPIRQNILS